jgi:hypothetical protein
VISVRLAFGIVVVAVVLVVVTAVLAFVDHGNQQEKCEAMGGELYRSLCLLPDGKVRKV